MSPKDPSEIIVVSFDFSALATAVISPVVSITLEHGVYDPAPSDMIAGAAFVDGALVRQLIIGGREGSTYKLRCQADTVDGNRYVSAANMAVAIA